MTMKLVKLVCSAFDSYGGYTKREGIYGFKWFFKDSSHD